MIADDNMFIRFLVKKWLGTEATIVETGSGMEVIEAYLKHRPDILFLDIHLPGRSGKEILSELMNDEPDAFVVMLSADSNKENVIHSVRVGAKAFITKPFTRETLLKYYNMCPTITRAEAASGNESAASDTA